MEAQSKREILLELTTLSDGLSDELPDSANVTELSKMLKQLRQAVKAKRTAATMLLEEMRSKRDKELKEIQGELDNAMQQSEKLRSEVKALAVKTPQQKQSESNKAHDDPSLDSEFLPRSSLQTPTSAR